ncbi:MAG: sigma-54-dependent Fis family transcriptional regulator [Acidobacteria bacterium]|nr:sigma-54-dependent Fis family transcriptional regulator [Acidobacteriota bacterium]
MKCPVLVVDDERVSRESLAAWLREDGHEVDTAASGAEAVAKAQGQRYAVCLVDLKMPGMDGIETMVELRRQSPDAAVIIITAYATVDTAVQAMKKGADDYIVKPFNPQEISLLVERSARVHALERQNRYLLQRLSRRYRFQDIVSKSPRMHEIFALIREVANLRSTVLVYGESGVGKELVARAIHYSGERASRPFVAVPCAALTETLLESELFGHERGAFTGAVARKRGKFELAHGGTIFLDEIGEIPPRLQADLLRVLQERSFFRVGGTEEISVDARVVAATNKDLQAMVQAGTFRDDLYYRLNVIAIRIPPLRERREDIPLLARHFVERHAAEMARPVAQVSEGAIRALLAHDWPGNARELENAIERAMVTSQGQVLQERDFSFLAQAAARSDGWEPPDDLSLQEVERRLVAAVLRRTGGNVKEAAAILGIDRSTLYDKMKRYEMRR